MNKKNNFTKAVISSNMQDAFNSLLESDHTLRSNKILLGDWEMQFKHYTFETERLAMQFIESNQHGRYNIASVIDLGELNLPQGMHKYLFYGKIE